MAVWSVEFSTEAERDLAGLDRPIRRRIINKLEWLSGHFDETVPPPLRAEWSNFFKLRVGDWRIVYTISWENHKIMVRYIDRRDKIYKRR